MGTTKLNLESNVSDLFAKLDQINGSVKQLVTNTDAYGERSKQAFGGAAMSAKQLKEEIKLQTAAIKEMEREEQKLANLGSKRSAAEEKHWKRTQGDIKQARQEMTQLHQKQEQLNNTADKSGAMFKKLGGIMAGAFSAVAVISFFKHSLEGLKSQEIAEAQLLNSLAGRRNLQTKLIEQAKDLSKVTLFKDEDIISSQSILSVFVKQESQLKGLTPLVADFAQKFGMGLPEAAKQVGKAVSGSAVAMKKLGFDITGTAGSTERFNSVMQQLTEKVGGAAVAAAETNLGSVENLSKAWGEFGETLVSLVGPSLSFLAKGLTEVTQAADTFFSDKTLSAWQKFVLLLKAGTGNIVGATDILTDAIISAAEEQRNALGPSRDGYEDFLAFLEEEKQKAEDIAFKAAKTAEERQKIRDMYYQQEIANIKQLQGWINELDKNVGEIGETLNTEKGMFDIPDPTTEVDGWIQGFNSIYNAATDAYAGTTQAQKSALESQLSNLEEYKRYLKPEEYIALYDQIQKKLEGLKTFSEKHPLLSVLGFENQEQVDKAKESLQQVMSFVTEMVDQQVEASKQLVEDLNTRIDEQQQLLNRENEDKAAGLANNYTLESENLKKMQKARDEAIKDRQRMIKIQQNLALVENGIAMTTSVANVIKGFSSIPIVGVALGLAAAATLIAGFILTNKKAKDAIQMGEGGQALHGLLTGKRHSQGGIPIIAEDQEWFINRNSSKKYNGLLSAINRDDEQGIKLFFDRKYLNNIPQIGGKDRDYTKNFNEVVREMKRGKVERIYGNGFYIETIGGYTKKINLN